MWDFCLRIECPQKLKPNIWICRAICTFGPTPTAKISQLFLLVFFGLLGWRFFLILGKVMSWWNFIIPARMRRMRHSCAIIAPPQKFYLRKFYFNLFFSLLLPFLVLVFSEFFAFTLPSFMNFNERFFGGSLAMQKNQTKTKGMQFLGPNLDTSNAQCKCHFTLLGVPFLHFC